MIRLTLPLPPEGCSPNDRVHWRTKAKAVREYRSRAAAEGRRIPASKRPRWERAETEVVFYFAVRRRRDEDNAAARLKPAWDGIADAGIVVNDSGLTHGKPRFEIDREWPRVEITLRPLEDAPQEPEEES